MDKSKIIESLGLQLPVIAAPMFLVSNQSLVQACLKEGIVGSYPSLNSRTTSEFSAWIDNLQASTSGETAFAINLIVHPSNERWKEDLSICVQNKVPLVITSLGAVSEVVNAVHSYGGLVFHDVTNMRHAKKAMDAGVDGLILVCSGAGGHGGQLNPFAFVADVRKVFDGVICLAGAMNNGSDVASALMMGADLAYLGTRFIATQEANAPSGYKEMIVDSKTSDISYTAAVSGIHGNYLNSSLEKAGISKDMLSSSKKIDMNLDSEAKAWKDIWSAGQGVAGINSVPSVAQLTSELKSEFTNAIAGERFKQWS